MIECYMFKKLLTPPNIHKPLEDDYRLDKVFRNLIGCKAESSNCMRNIQEFNIDVIWPDQRRAVCNMLLHLVFTHSNEYYYERARIKDFISSNSALLSFDGVIDSLLEKLDDCKDQSEINFDNLRYIFILIKSLPHKNRHVILYLKLYIRYSDKLTISKLIIEHIPFHTLDPNLSEKLIDLLIEKEYTLSNNYATCSYLEDEFNKSFPVFLDKLTNRLNRYSVSTYSSIIQDEIQDRLSDFIIKSNALDKSICFNLLHFISFNKEVMIHIINNTPYISQVRFDEISLSHINSEEREEIIDAYLGKLKEKHVATKITICDALTTNKDTIDDEGENDES
jgi:hypothetical protein